MCGGRKIRDNFVSSSQFCCGPKTVPKNKFYFLKSTLKTIPAYYMVYPDDGILCVWVTQPYLTVIPWTVALQVPLSMEFSKQEYWSGLPCPSPEDLPNPVIELTFTALHVDSLLTHATTWKILETIMLGEISQSQRATYYMISFMKCPG